MAIVKRHILIVEDNTAIRDFVAYHISNELHLDTIAVSSMAEAMAIISSRKADIFLAVLDLNLPDAPNGEIVDTVLAEGLPVIVLTGSVSKNMHDLMAAKLIIDYIVKKNRTEMRYLITLIDRIWKNKSTKAMVVDDSPETREYLKILLKLHHFRTYTAKSAEIGLQILEENPDIKLIVTDYMMPGLNGDEFILKVREQYSREELAIISISSSTENDLPATLLKSGANDFMIRPFRNEEFFCRLGNNIDSVRNFASVRDAAIRDHLTGMYNRKYLFEAGTKLYDNAKRDNITIASAMFDIDHFKKINDTWGHHIGDLALKHVSRILEEQLRSSDMLVRMGGEEFCAIATNINKETADMLFNRIREAIANTPLEVENATVNITISIGVTFNLNDSLDNMINAADAALYAAKEGGRNRVVFDE